MRGSIKYIFLILLFIGSVFYISPFYKYRKGELTIGFITTSVITKKIIKNNHTDSSKALALFNFVTGKLKHPTKFHQPIDDNCFQIIKYKYASCDQQSNVLISLAFLSGIKGRLLFLYGNDSISHHSVCELKIGNSYRIFCPYFKKVFYTKQNTFATIRDIQRGNLNNPFVIIPEKVNLSQKEYYHLFDTLYPYKVFKTNQLHLTEKEVRNRKAFDVWYSIFGDLGLKPLLSFISIHSNYTDEESEIIENLIFN